MEGDNQGYAAADPGTRLRDLEERNKILKERILLLGRNLLDTKDELEESVEEIKKQNLSILKQIEQLTGIVQGLVDDTSKTVKRDEMLLLERMLRDFQPLEFMRRKDVEELIAEKTKKR